MATVIHKRVQAEDAAEKKHKEEVGDISYMYFIHPASTLENATAESYFTAEIFKVTFRWCDDCFSSARWKKNFLSFSFHRCYQGLLTVKNRTML